MKRLSVLTVVVATALFGCSENGLTTASTQNSPASIPELSDGGSDACEVQTGQRDSEIEPFVMRQNVPVKVGDANFAVGNIGVRDIDGEERLSVAVFEWSSAGEFDNNETIVPNCGTYDFFGREATIHVLDDAVELYAVDGAPLDL